MGTHAAATGKTSRRSRSSSRRRPSSLGDRAGEIHQMHVPTHSVEGRRAQHGAVGSRTQNIMTKQRRTNKVFGVIVVLLIIALAVGLGSCAYRASVSSGIALNDEEVSQVLTKSEEDQPYYILLAGLSDSDTAHPKASYVALLRVDEANKQFALIEIPTNIVVELSQSGDFMLRDAPSVGGEAELVSKTADLFGVEIAHYVRTTETDFENLVDSVGGLTLNVAQRVDDPRVSSVVIDVGKQTLSGTQALTYVSAYNYKDPVTTRANIQSEVFSALLDAISAKGGVDFVSSVDSLSSCIKTDMDFDKLNALVSVYNERSAFYTAVMPGSQYVLGTDTYFSVSSSTWESMRDRLNAGEDPQTSLDTSGVDKASLSLVVLNGSGVTGLAAEAAELLQSKGYTVSETGNTPSYVYDETLVVYREDKDKASAEAVVTDLGIGRTVASGIYYDLNSDVQVIIGKDWKAS